MVTVPVGEPAPRPMRSRSLIGPKADGFVDEDEYGVRRAFLTTWFTAPEERCGEVGIAIVGRGDRMSPNVQVAGLSTALFPAERSVARIVEPSVKVTLPVGDPAPDRSSRLLIVRRMKDSPTN